MRPSAQAAGWHGAGGGVGAGPFPGPQKEEKAIDPACKLERYSPEELEQVLGNLSHVFEDVRLVDPAACKELALSPEGSLVEQGACYERWYICDRCENCVSLRAVRDNRKYEKFELLGESVYQVVVKPVAVAGRDGSRLECAIEVAVRSSVDEYGAMLSSSPEVDRAFLDRKGFFVDWSTRAYNRRFFDEGVSLGRLNLKSSIDLGVIVCKVENAEYLVDMFGSEEREAAARRLAQLLERRCRPHDIIIRVDDDKFLVIVPSAGFEGVRSAADGIRLDAPAELSGGSRGAGGAPLSVGFAWASVFGRTNAHVNELFREAEENAYLDRRGIRKSWDELNGSWKFSVSDAVKAASGGRGAWPAGAAPPVREGGGRQRMEDASTIAGILEAAPETAADPLSVWFREFAKKDRRRPSEAFRFPLPMMDKPFEPGGMGRAADSIEDKVTRDLAQVEVSYLNGDYLRAGKGADALMADSNDLPTRAAAGLLGTLANLAANHPAFARQAKDSTVMLCQGGMLGSGDPRVRTACAIVDGTVMTFFGGDRASPEPISEMLSDLPEGQRLFASFLIAHQKFTAGEFGNALGVVSTALSYCADVYPVPMVYLHVMAASAHMALRRAGEAAREFGKAWDLARQDRIFAPFAEHYVKLQGLPDACLKRTEPQAFRAISKAAQRFRAGWVCLVDPCDDSKLIATLNASEMTIAGLASRGWTNREIAAHLQLAENTVKHRMSFIYQKLHIDRRSDLPRLRLT